MQRLNCYEVLGVHQAATDEEVRRAYRRLALLNHPDRGGSHAVMIRINQAYAVLRDPYQRVEHDAELDRASRLKPIRMGAAQPQGRGSSRDGRSSHSRGYSGRTAPRWRAQAPDNGQGQTKRQERAEPVADKPPLAAWKGRVETGAILFAVLGYIGMAISAMKDGVWGLVLFAVLTEVYWVVAAKVLDGLSFMLGD